MKIKNRKELFKLIDKGIKQGVSEAIAEHKRAGRTIAVWKNGKIVMIPSDKQLHE